MLGTPNPGDMFQFTRGEDNAPKGDVMILLGRVPITAYSSKEKWTCLRVPTAGVPWLWSFQIQMDIWNNVLYIIARAQQAWQ